MGDEAEPQVDELTDVPVVVRVGGGKERVGTVESVYTDDEGHMIANIRID